MKIHSFSSTDVGKVRKANEDNFGQSSTINGELFIVCDGMGGHVGGATASKIAVDSLIDYFNKEKYDNPILAINSAFQFANEQVYASALSNLELKGMGTTGVLLLIVEEDCYIGHVGDSRIYLHSNGILNRITKDHSFVQTLVDGGIISDDEAESHPQKNQILKALGIAPNIEATVNRSAIHVKGGDVFMLCTDGLNGMVNDKSMEMMIQYDNIESSTHILIKAALDSGGLDNVTATLVAIDESSHVKSQFIDYNPKISTKLDQTDFNLIRSKNTLKDSKKGKRNIVFLTAIGLCLIFFGLVFFTDLFSKAVKKDKTANLEVTLSKISDHYPINSLRDLKGKKVVNYNKDSTLIVNGKDIIEIKKGEIISVTISKETEIKINIQKELNKKKIENKQEKKEESVDPILSKMNSEDLDKLEKGEFVSEKADFNTNKFKFSINENGKILSIKKKISIEFKIEKKYSNEENLLNDFNDTLAKRKCEQISQVTLNNKFEKILDRKIGENLKIECFCEK